MKIAESRINESYLYQTSRRSFLYLTLLQAVCLGGWLSLRATMTLASSSFKYLAILQALASAVILILVIQNIRRSRLGPIKQQYSDKELPTLTIAIPARNETDELNECLLSILAADYPKLEIVVLDDSSQTDTAEIIKRFAHAGVRFIKGKALQSFWLAKNQAYAQLAQEATGDYILFCGVDVRFDKQSLRLIISKLRGDNLSMISVLPLRRNEQLSGLFVQPMRYWWELALPRQQMKQPASLSTCWIVSHDSLNSIGNFESVKHSIRPEGFIARELQRTHAYAFIRGNQELGISSVKSTPGQIATAVRTRYPEVRKRPEAVMAVSLGLISLLLAPFGLATSAILYNFDRITLIAALSACTLLVIAHILILACATPRKAWIGLFNFPLTVGIELVLLHISMWKYEFGKVLWKGRDVVAPVMHTIPHLPQLDV